MKQSIKYLKETNHWTTCQSCGFNKLSSFPNTDQLIKITDLVLSKLKIFNLLSVQPTDSNVAKLTLLSGQELYSEVKTTKFKAVLSVQEVNSVERQNAIEELISSEIALEINRWSISKMLNSVAVQRKIDKKLCRIDCLKNFIKNQALKTVKDIQDVTGRPCSNWLVTSPNIVDALLGESSFNRSNQANQATYNPLDIYQAGIWETELGNISVFSDPLIDEQILFGYKGESNLDSGCVYGPNVIINKSPTILDQETLTPMTCFTHYGHLTITDNSYYGSLNLFQG